MIRRLIPALILPLAVVANALASAPWLRAFPATTLAVPLFGAAVLSIAIPLVTSRWLRSTAASLAVDIIAFILYSLLIVLKSPFGFGDLIDGLQHGPAQLLTFALPLVSPATLLVTPVAICWLTGAVAAEILIRNRQSAVPNLAWLIAFGISYAATERATSLNPDHLVDVLLALALLATLAVLRVAQVWTRGAAGPEATVGEGELPLRPALIGVAAAVGLTLLAGVVVQAGVFGGTPTAPQRVPAVDQAAPVTPLSFVAALRPSTPNAPNPRLFTVSTQAPSTGYFAVANVDFYDGDSWSFTRTFRPSGGVVPADLDSSLTPSLAKIDQHYRISAGALTSAPWMPYLSRPVTVNGAAINVDPTTGMIVPAVPVQAGTNYDVSSLADARTLQQLPVSSLVSTGAAPIDTQLPASIRATMAKVVDSFGNETGQSPSTSMQFLQALAADLHKNYALSGSPSPSVDSDTHTGGTNFSDVVASIIGPQRAGTPEQFATMFALVARQLGVPARVSTGFKVATSASLPAGTYEVTASQASTWVEVPVRGIGWVVVDAAPTSYQNSQQNKSVGAAPTPSAPAAPSQKALLDTNNGGHAVAKQSDVPVSKGGSVLPAVLLGVGVVLVLVLLVVVSLLLRKRRRRRLRHGRDDPRQRVIGAWAETLDVLVESGLSDIEHLTGTEIAAVAAQRYGEESGTAVATLARTADVALYSTQPISDDLADDAWDTENAVIKSVHSQLGITQRFVAALKHSSTTQARPGPAGPTSWAEAERGAGPARRPGFGWLRGRRH